MKTKLSEKFCTERETLCNKLIEILELDEDNSFLLYELDNNNEKQQKILALKTELAKFFAVSSLAPFKPNIEHTKRDYLNIVRGILKQQGYKFISNEYSYKQNNNLKRTVKYFILKDIQRI